MNFMSSLLLCNKYYLQFKSENNVFMCYPKITHCNLSHNILLT